MSNNPFFKDQVASVSTQGNTGILDVSCYKSLLILINVTALTGTSVTFKVRTYDAYGTLYSLVATSAITTTGTVGALSVVEATGAPFGDNVTIEWDPSSATFSADITIYAS